MLDRRPFESQCFQEGYRCVAGIDEVGMGCLAGPVVAAAVVLDLDQVPKGIRDSKLLTLKQREALDAEIRKRAVAVAVALATPEEIDTINILRASQLAMCRAVGLLSVVPDFLLIDGRFRIDHPCRQLPIIKGDRLSVSIGAASIVAKVFRDTWMAQMDVQYPGYGFASHKGYGSAEHRRNLQANGPTPLHRKSFSWTPV